MSGGERQRVALARALARRPEALLLDEPLSALDARTRASASRELGAVLRETGVPALLVTHDFTEAALLGDRVGVVDGGRVVQQGTAAELAASPASAFVADFTGAVVLTGTARTGSDGLTHVALDGGGTVASTRAGRRARRGQRLPVGDHHRARRSDQTRGRRRTTSTSRSSRSPPSATASASGLAAPQPLTAEITDASAQRMHLAPGARAVATWKAASTRLLRR